MLQQGSETYVLKILLIGNSGVGKSCMLTRFTDNRFSNNFYNTVGVDYAVKYIQCAQDVVKLQIWDTAGQERFRTMSTSYYRGAHGIIIVYDVTDRASFINIQSWWNEMSRQTSRDVAALLVGNKTDMEQQRVVGYEEGRKLAGRYGIPFMETSAKTGANVQSLFYEMTNLVLDTADIDKLKNNKPSKLKIPRPKGVQTKNCCC